MKATNTKKNIFEPSERQPLLAERRSPGNHGVLARRDPRRTRSETVVYHQKKAQEEANVGLKRHIGLLDCIAIIVGNVIGSGIFISPKGVYENVGSVGACLVVWGAMGMYALLQALCYAELGVVIPRAGGDYAYVYHILGPLPAFLCAWVQMVIVATSANGVISQTAGIYIMQPFGLECETTVVSCIAVTIILLFAAVNMYSSTISTRVQLLFSGAKVMALCTIIITGIVLLSSGNVDNFKDPFKGTTTDLGLISLSAMDGYFAYKGWELVNTLPEEMINPKRDLPLGVAIAMTVITTIYVMTNVAYFTVLSTADLLASSAVALTFTERTLGVPTRWLLSIGVALSCMGTINGSFLSDSRYLFAAGRTRQVPRLFSMIHYRYMTPIAAMVLLLLLSVMYGLIPSVEQLQQYTSLAVQLKILTALTALIYFRWKKPDIKRPIKIPMVVILLVVVFMIVLLGLSIYKNPTTTGVGLGIFLLGIPVHYLATWCKRFKITNHAIDVFTVGAQRLCLVVPELKENEDPFHVPHNAAVKDTLQQ